MECGNPCECEAIGFDGLTYPEAIDKVADELETAEDVLNAILWETVDPITAAREWLAKHAPGLLVDEDAMTTVKAKARLGAAATGKPYAECLNWV
jgi:hypothetical protein